MGVDHDTSNTARAYIIIIGHNDMETERLWLDLPGRKKSFTIGTMEHFVCYATDVGEIKRVEVRIWDCLVLSLWNGLFSAAYSLSVMLQI